MSEERQKNEANDTSERKSRNRLHPFMVAWNSDSDSVAYLSPARVHITAA
jgi:hypothetical protein